MSFGLTNALAIFVETMNNILRRFLDNLSLCSLTRSSYIKTYEELESHLRPVLETWRKNKFYAKLKKCEFWFSEVAFLGHVTNQQGILVDPSKVSTIIDWPRPSRVQEVRSFLGLAAYYRSL
jgi:hypothetical protein